MVKGGTNFRKASGKRFKKRKCPRRSSLTSSTNEFEVETISINETADNNHEEDGEISGPSTALPTVPISWLGLLRRCLILTVKKNHWSVIGLLIFLCIFVQGR